MSNVGFRYSRIALIGSAKIKETDWFKVNMGAQRRGGAIWKTRKLWKQVCCIFKYVLFVRNAALLEHMKTDGDVHKTPLIGCDYDTSNLRSVCTVKLHVAPGHW